MGPMTVWQWVWIATGVVAWLVVAVTVGVTVGLMITRVRDRQVPNPRCWRTAAHDPHLWRPTPTSPERRCPGVEGQ